MATMTKLRKVGGSMMLAIPPVLLEQMNLTVDSPLELHLESDSKLSMIKLKSSKKSYRLEDLVAQCDPSQPEEPEILEWLNAPRVGKELI